MARKQNRDRFDDLEIEAVRASRAFFKRPTPKALEAVVEAHGAYRAAWTGEDEPQAAETLPVSEAVVEAFADLRSGRKVA